MTDFLYVQFNYHSRIINFVLANILMQLNHCLTVPTIIIIVNCTVPAELCNGAIERLNETVLEGTVLTYQCDNGLSLTRLNTITCTNAGVWSTEPEEIKCVLVTEGDELCNCLLSTI